jgi:hypothetical protein
MRAVLRPQGDNVSAEGMIRCGSPMERGVCTRRLRPGERCPDHGILAPPDGSEPKPLKAKPCSCSRPVTFEDDFEVRCVRCGRTVEARRPVRRSRLAKKRPAGDPSPFFPGDQLTLDLEL